MKSNDFAAWKEYMGLGLSHIGSGMTLGVGRGELRENCIHLNNIKYP